MCLSFKVSFDGLLDTESVGIKQKAFMTLLLYIYLPTYLSIKESQPPASSRVSL